MTATPSPTIHFSPRAQAFLQANEDALRQLVTFVDFAAEKFTLGFVSVNFPEDRATIVEALEQHPDCQEIQFVRFKFDDPDLRFLRDELIRELPDIERDPNRKLVILLTGLEASIGMVGDYPPVLQDLNYVRDGFAASVPYPIVVFLPDKSLSRLAEFAPDFWAWRMAVIRFKSSAETVKSRLKEVFQVNGNSELVEARERHSEVLDSQAKRDMIPRLLMEYEFGSLSDDPEFKAFKSDLMAELGVSHYDNDDLDVAKDLLVQVITAGDSARSIVSKPKAYCYLGIIESRQDNYEQAINLLNQAILRFERLEENRGYFDLKNDLKQAIAHRGFAHCLMGNCSEALVDLNRAIEMAPNFHWAIARRSFTYFLLGDYQKALIDLNYAIELNPKYHLTIALRGEIYRRLKRYSEALADFNRAIELDPEHKLAIALRGEIYRRLKRYSEALADFNRAIELNPNDQWAIAHRGETYQLLECYSEALVDFNRAIELDSNNKWAITQRGFVYFVTECYLEATTDFNRAIEIDPNYTLAIVERGLVYYQIEKYPDALVDFNRAIELSSIYEVVSAFRGETYRQLEYYLEALADFDRAIELNPDDQFAIAHRGETYRQLGRYPEALADFDRVIELNPNDQWAIASRGQTYRAMKRYEEALQDFNRALTLDPDSEWKLAERGETYRQLGCYPEALADFDRAIELNPDDQFAIAHRGETYRQLGRYPEALADFDQVVELDPEYYWAIASRGQIYRAMKRYTQALDDFSHAIELDGDDWDYYNRTLLYLATDQADKAHMDLAKAVKLAQKDYEEDPQDCQNIFNLALYYLADGNINQAKHFYQIGLTNNPSTILIKDAIRDLEDLLTVLPNYPNADMLRQHLQSALKDSHQSSH